MTYNNTNGSLSSHYGDGGLGGAGGCQYPDDLDRIRENEYPLLKDTIYLDHAGATLYAKSLMERFSREMTSHLFGNPHSVSSSSQLSTRRVDDARLKVLQFFNTSSDDFDVVFTANATAGIKLVADAFRDVDDGGFWYGYHAESHTSLVGVREVAAKGERCFLNDSEVEDWMAELYPQAGKEDPSYPKLFAYPAQSNMTGRRLPLTWCKRLRACNELGRAPHAFSLLDAASLVSTTPLDLSDPDAAPDFTVLSFYKIFGFPDLGALIVRKASGHVFQKRKYFGGGTVGMVMSLGEQRHEKKSTSVHDQLEDGTLPFHSIIALSIAMDVHERLYGSMASISRHTCSLAARLYARLSAKRHVNGKPVCEIYKHPSSSYEDPVKQGPIVCFNLMSSKGEWIGKSEVERLAGIKNIQIRSGGLCNPGGIAHHLNISPEETISNFNAGQRCGDGNDVMGGKPTGAVRVSLGAMSSASDVDRFLEFIDEFYVDKGILQTPVPNIYTLSPTSPTPKFYVEKISVYPIKSCGAFVIPDGASWQIKPEGLAWDREWCLIHRGTGVALNQKRYPLMALIRPVIDLDRGVLRVFCGVEMSSRKSIELPLSDQEAHFAAANLCENSTRKSSQVCGDRVTVNVYSSPVVSEFFSSFLDVPCSLARFPPNSGDRYSKSWLSPKNLASSSSSATMPGSFPGNESPAPSANPPTRLLLSNESPMLLISRSSVNRLNESIKFVSKSGNNAKAVAADVFRANIVVAEDISASSSSSAATSHPYIEDTWTGFKLNGHKFDVLGSCQRCQMICVDQFTGERGEEPYSTLAKTRKINGKVVFGRHVCLSNKEEVLGAPAEIRVGDAITPI